METWKGLWSTGNYVLLPLFFTKEKNGFLLQIESSACIVCVLVPCISSPQANQTLYHKWNKNVCCCFLISFHS